MILQRKEYLMTTSSSRDRKYTFFLSFSALFSVLFFLGIYCPFAHTIWLSLLTGGILAWIVLTLIIRKQVSLAAYSPIKHCLSLLSIGYGGFVLYAFFVFCHRVIFPDHNIFFFPVLFLIVIFWGASAGIAALERTSKFTSTLVIILFLLTVISTTQKIWDQKEFVLSSLPAIVHIDVPVFLFQTVFVFCLFLVQSLVLFLTVEDTCDAPQILCSIRKALIPSCICSSLLYLLAVLALGTSSFEFLTYPIYDMLSLPGYAEYLDRTELLMLIIFLFCESCKTIASILAGRKLFIRKKSTLS